MVTTVVDFSHRLIAVIAQAKRGCPSLLKGEERKHDNETDYAARQSPRPAILCASLAHFVTRSRQRSDGAQSSDNFARFTCPFRLYSDF